MTFAGSSKAAGKTSEKTSENTPRVGEVRQLCHTADLYCPVPNACALACDAVCLSSPSYRMESLIQDRNRIGDEVMKVFGFKLYCQASQNMCYLYGRQDLRNSIIHSGHES